MYSVAIWPPLTPTPRPSNRSLERNRVCSRILSAETEGACARHAVTPITVNPIDLIMYGILGTVSLPHLRALEAESIHIIREVAAEFQRPVMLYSIGKDSSVMVRLAQKAFHPGPIPFPLLNIDTTYKFREMIEFRDSFGQWDPKNQRPELWNLFNSRVDKGESIRVFPLSNWTELDVWHYIYSENIPIVPMYYAKPRPMVIRGESLIPVEHDIPLLP